MRLVLANPHIHQYGKTLADFLTRRKAAIKYTYFKNQFIKNSKRNVAFLIDGTRSSFNELGIRFFLWPKFFAYLELCLWLMINGANPLRFKIYFNVKKLNPKKDIIFNCSFTTLDLFARNNNQMQFHKYNGLVVNHLTHYFCGTEAIADYLRKIKNSLLAAENDLSRNEFFQHHFPAVKKVYQLPFTYAERFKNTKPFSERLNKCFAIGTVFAPRHPDFIKYFGAGKHLHPMRQIIFENKNNLKEFIDCYIHNFDMRNLKIIFKDDPWKVKIAKKYLPFFLLTKILPSYAKEYFKFDVVEKYNQYRMFVSPEEIVGLPSINAFEGMACGSAFIGIDDPMYADCGLKPSVHYIAYKKNDLGDLVNKIEYYQERQPELKEIAQRGGEFVRNNFSQKKVAEVFWNDLENLLNNFNV